MSKTVLLLSGGLDSTTLLSTLMAQDGNEVLALSIMYGSLHETAEMKAANDVVAYYGINQEVLELPTQIFAGGKSALLGQSAMPTEEYHDINTESPSATIVPFRNANLISMAVSLANSRGYDSVAVANHATDAQGWAYPDCTPEFMGAMAAAVYVGTLREVRLQTPFQFFTKAGIVSLAAVHLAPLQLTRSCYKADPIACGECPTCLERIASFKTAGFIDPINYIVKPDWSTQGLKEFPK